MANHEILSGKVQLYRRTNKTWHCSASIDGVQHRASIKEDDLALARISAEDWYLNLRGLSRVCLIKKKEITFATLADQFELEYETITEGQRSPRWVEGHKQPHAEFRNAEGNRISPGGRLVPRKSIENHSPITLGGPIV